ncbi:SUKH-4 family immunity protein [Streptomyces yaizuensis]|uniref:SUKH-4 family immunity protein n=1 Tax=Streptomyces yaizuensis TaxID=2989713 RepID=A0ABQ5P9U0_9ACTN|nr:SUKH-4 family immunity protein [Streptomyces sp. YSPA8]GLF99361.1 SUKH-4 family immunity protein [Streptomyces sp. YSPA8]
MVTFAQAQERAEEWINGDMPPYQHREVRVREFALGFVAWAEDREGGARADGGEQRLVVARDGGEATLWPGLPVGEVIRRYEEEYGGRGDAPAAAVPQAPRRIDQNQTSFLLSPPEWLEEAPADRTAEPTASSASDASQAGGRPRGGDEVSDAPGTPAAGTGTPTRWNDTSSDDTDDDASVPLPDTVYTAPVGRSEREAAYADADAELPTALIPGGSQLPPTVRESREKVMRAVADSAAATAKPDAPKPDAPKPDAPKPDAPKTPPTPSTPPVQGTGTPPPAATPPPSGPGAPGVPASGYRPTRHSPELPPERPVPPVPPPVPATPPEGVHHAPTVLAPPAPQASPTPPPGPPPPPVPATPPEGVHHAPTVLAPPASATPPPGPPGPPPAAYGYPQQPAGVPTVGPGYQAVLRYRAPDGSEAQLIRRSAPGTPHPEWQILHELRALGVPPQQVLELHTELESCRLPGGYCARMIAETWPQARITSIAPYGTDHAGRQQGMAQLLTHQGELHQVADGPARPAPVRAPLPPVQTAPPVPPQALAQELAAAFGPQGICRFDQQAVSRQGVPEVVAATLAWAGLPADFNPFFWAQPAHPVVPTLAELAAQRQIQSAPDATSYLVLGNDFGRQICVQYGTAHIVAVPLEAALDGRPAVPQFVNSGLPEFVRCMAMLGRMWRFRYGLTPEQAGRWTVDFQAHLAALDPAALSSPDNWWFVLLEQMWDGLL